MKFCVSPVPNVSSTAWELFKYGVISGPYFPVFGLNTERYGVNTGKYGPEITPYPDTFHAVLPTYDKWIKQF